MSRWATALVVASIVGIATGVIAWRSSSAPRPRPWKIAAELE